MNKEKLVCADCGKDEITQSGKKVYTTDNEDDFGDDMWCCQHCNQSDDFVTVNVFVRLKEMEKALVQQTEYEHVVVRFYTRLLLEYIERGLSNKEVIENFCEDCDIKALGNQKYCFKSIPVTRNRRVFAI